MTNRTRRFVASARWLAAINITRSILMLTVGIVLARLILPGVFGEFAYLLASDSALLRR